MSGPYESLRKVSGPQPTATFAKAFVDPDEEHRDLERSLGKTSSTTETHGETASSASAATQSTSRAHSRQNARSSSQAISRGTNASVSTGENDSESHQRSSSIGSTESLAIGTAETAGGGITESESTTQGETLAPMLIPTLGKEESPPQFRSVEESLFIHSQEIWRLPDQHAIVRIGSTPPVRMSTPWLRAPRITAKGVQAFANLKLRLLPFALTIEEAIKRLHERRVAFESLYLDPPTGEPIGIVRRLKG